MEVPAISVLIPMYNRKHCIEDCVNSVLNQTFKDFEIVIRDNRSEDGSFEFVQQRYAKEISAGKIKLKLSFKNLGEFGSENHLLLDAAGKYVQFLHSDDILLPNALEYLYECAKTYNADVVHAQSFFVLPMNSNKAAASSLDRHRVNKITVMSNDPAQRFSEWIDNGTFWDVQYNLFNRNFLVDNEIFIEVPGGSSLTLALWWLMLAKVFVKVPAPVYVRRDSPDSLTNKKPVATDKIEKIITGFIELYRKLDQLFDKVEYFKDNPKIQYSIKAHCHSIYDGWNMNRLAFYKDGITEEINETVEKVFKKYFGNDYAYPALLFNLAHVLPFNKSFEKITPAPTPPHF